MLKSCKYCMRIHDSKYDCGKKPVIRKKYTKYDRYRSSAAWQKKREDIKIRDGGVCKVCIDNRVLNTQRLGVHHIVSLEDGFSLREEDDNLITLCSGCHERAEEGSLSREYLRSLVRKKN